MKRSIILFTPLEIMPRCSAAGLDFRIIPAGFNAPLEFLTGFTLWGNMTLTKEDLAILDKFNFDVQPVSVKFMVRRPDMVERLNENMALCEMLKKAQEGNAFYAD